MKHQRRRRRAGRPRKLDADAKRQALAILAVGGSLADVQRHLDVDRKTLSRERRRDGDFARGVNRAVVAGKVRHLRTIAGSPDWRAAAWMLERRHGFGGGGRGVF